MGNNKKSWQLFLESLQEGVSGLKFGELTKPRFVKMVDEKIRLIDFNPDDVPDRPFPKNDSEEVKREIQHIIRKMSDNSFDRKELITLDKKAMTQFYEYMDEQNLKYDRDYLEELSDDMSRFALRLKMKYQRPRPDQLAPLLGYELKDVPTSTDDSPSYPSGHTLVGWSIALHLSDKYPEHKAAFYDIAGKIEDSRIVRGAHFLSDNVFSRLLARKYVVPNIKE